MARLFVVSCPALSFGLATRGDSTLHIPDLIADGGVAPVTPGTFLPDIEGKPDYTIHRLEDLVNPDGPVAEVLQKLDERIGALREQAREAGAEMVVVSEYGAGPSPASEAEHAVIVSSVPHSSLEPGKVIPAAEVGALLTQLAAR